jgi:excisionase family DNA binding protein
VREARFSPASLAEILGVSESTVKRWVDRDLLRGEKTAGGHRKIALADVVAFLRTGGRAVPALETLGLLARRNPRRASALTPEQLAGLLVQGDTDTARAFVLAQFTGGRLVEEILDRLVGPALADIGERWARAEVDVYEEHLATQRCWRILTELRQLMPAPPDTAPLALGGAPEGDPYVIPTCMAELTLREMRWRTLNLGANVPASSLRTAIERHRPRLVWISITSTAVAPAFFGGYPAAYEAAERGGAAVILGGQGLTPVLQREALATAFGSRLAHLKALAQALAGSGPESTRHAHAVPRHPRVDPARQR